MINFLKIVNFVFLLFHVYIEFIILFFALLSYFYYSRQKKISLILSTSLISLAILHTIPLFFSIFIENLSYKGVFLDRIFFIAFLLVYAIVLAKKASKLRNVVGLLLLICVLFMSVRILYFELLKIKRIKINDHFYFQDDAYLYNVPNGSAYDPSSFFQEKYILFEKEWKVDGVYFQGNSFSYKPDYYLMYEKKNSYNLSLNLIDFKSDYSDMSPIFTNGIGWFEKDGSYGLIDTLGQVLTDAIYENPPSCLKGQFFLVTQNNKLGIVNSIGKVILPAEYSKITYYTTKLPYFKNGGLAFVKKGNLHAFISLSDGSVVVPFSNCENFEEIIENNISGVLYNNRLEIDNYIQQNSNPPPKRDSL